MITTKIQVKDFLAEYAKLKFSAENQPYIQIPDSDYLYHVIYNVMEKRPADALIDSGNLEIALPHRSRGKEPETYNYICESAQRIIERKLEKRFWAELHDFVDERVHEYGELINESVFIFMKTFNVTAITEDALIKNYYRWRSKSRRKIKKRKYSKYATQP